MLSGPQISTVLLADTHEFLKKTGSITCIVPRSRLPISLWVLYPPEHLTFRQLLSRRLLRRMLVVLAISSSHVDGLSPLIKTATLDLSGRLQLSLGFPSVILISRTRYPHPFYILYCPIPYPSPFFFSIRFDTHKTASLRIGISS